MAGKQSQEKMRPGTPFSGGARLFIFESKMKGGRTGMRKAVALLVLAAFVVVALAVPAFAGPIGIQPPELPKKPGYELPVKPEPPKFAPRPKLPKGPEPVPLPPIVPGPKPAPKPVPKPVPKDPVVKPVVR